jgi:beta-glucosidase
LERKVRLLTGAAMFSLWPEPDIDLDELVLSDGPTGVRGVEFSGGAITALLPNATLLAAHWDVVTAREVGDLLADEAIAQKVHVVLGPTINLHRTPIGGRLFEAFSEDPYLTGKLAAAYVQGLQAKGISATPKHFLANESETERTTVDSQVSEKTLREIYLLPFEITVSDANPWAIMAAYNKINGVTATEHQHLVNEVLKDEWGYDGLVMSDWWATTSTAASANGGLDLVMPGPVGPWAEKLVAAVKSGEVAESIVDDQLRRLLTLAERVGAFGTKRDWPSVLKPDSAQRRDLLRRLAAGGMTVLANKDDILPLSQATSIAVIGRHATDTIAQGGGSAQVRPPHVISIADGISAAFDTVTVTDGVETRTRPVLPAADALRDPETGLPGIRVTIKDSLGDVIESRHSPLAEVIIGHGGWVDSATSIELTAEVSLTEPTRMQIGHRGLGDWTFEVHENQTSVQQNGIGVLGEGVLIPPTWTMEADLVDGDRITAFQEQAAEHTVLSLVARPAPLSPAQAISNAVHAAENADVAVVVIGLTQEQETESVDKSTLALPGEQDAMIAAVAGVARRTVVVVNAATPILMPWLSQVDAVLWAGLPGQEAGAAVAAALRGDIEPAGRLVTTFPAADRQGPTWSTTPTDGALEYAEGVSVGYRGWTMEKPLFWFGHGLGYTTWAYGTASAVQTETVDTVTIPVTNTGKRGGREIVQVYLRPETEPTRLIGWAAIDAAAGETVEVEVQCDARAQRVWTGSGWQFLARTGEILVARGLGDVRSSITRS